MDCVFCKIINNEINSYTLFEDKIVKVIMDINPSSNGHILIVPIKHTVTIFDTDLETMNHINVIIKKMNKLLNYKLNPDGIKILINNGMGQDIKHFHVHMIPVYKENKLSDIKDIFEILKVQ
jgi:histidine triad (HIT) family protein